MNDDKYEQVRITVKRELAPKEERDAYLAELNSALNWVILVALAVLVVIVAVAITLVRLLGTRGETCLIF